MTEGTSEEEASHIYGQLKVQRIHFPSQQESSSKPKIAIMSRNWS